MLFELVSHPCLLGHSCTVLGISEVIGYGTVFGEIVNTWLVSIVCKSIDTASLGFLKSQAILQTFNTCYKIIL